MASERQRPVLSDHRQRGKRLVPPLAELPVQMMDWEGVHLPEHLWLAYLMRDGNVSGAAATFNTVCDPMDTYFVPHDQGDIFLGYMSDFNRISEAGRREVIRQLGTTSVAEIAFGRDFRALLSLYPQGPASWLALPEVGRKTRGDGVKLARKLVQTLRDKGAKKTIQSRILGLNRMLKHGKIFFSPNVVDDALADGLARYPFTEDETTARVEQFVKVTMNIVFQNRMLTNWSVQFWTANFAIVRCR